MRVVLKEGAQVVLKQRDENMQADQGVGEGVVKIPLCALCTF